MSVGIELDDLAAAIERYDDSAYVVVNSGEGAPRVTHVRPVVANGQIAVDLGRGSRAAAVANPQVTVLWTATESQSMSLIVDGDATVSDDDDGVVSIMPTSAVLHRPAPGASSPRGELSG